MITKSNFSILAILIIATITTTPILFNELYVMVLWILFYFVEFNKINDIDSKLSKILILGIVFVFMCAVYAIIGVSNASIAYCVHNPLLFFAPVLALMVIEKCNNEQQIRFIFHFLALAIAINIADNIRLTYQMGLDNVVYQKIAGMMQEEGQTGLNMGGAGFVNMAVFYACTMFMAFLQSNKKFEKLLFLIYVGISSYFILACSLKASAIILLLLSLVLMYVSVKSKKRIGTIVTIMFVVGVFVFIYRDFIIGLLIEIIASDRVTSRLMVFMTEGDMEDSNSLMTREGLWLVSVESWLSGVRSFFLGIGDHDWKKFMRTEDSGIGNHSDLLDVLGRYGIIGALVLYSSIKIYYNYLQERFGSLFKFEVITFFILLLAIGFTKKFIMAQTAIVIFILFPLALRYFYNQKTI